MHRDDKEARRVLVPRILDDSDWDILCQKRHSRRKLSLKNQKHEYLCKDLLICAECGVPLAARPKYPNKKSRLEGTQSEYQPIHYYTCARKQKISGFRCTASKCHPICIIDSLIWEQAKSILLDPKLLKQMDASVKKFQPSQTEQIKKQLDMATLKMENLKLERERAIKFLVNGTISENEYSPLAAESKREEYNLLKTIDELKSDLCNRIQGIDSNASLEIVFSKFGPNAEALSFPQRREVVQALIHSIFIQPSGEMEVHYKTAESGVLI